MSALWHPGFPTLEDLAAALESPEFGGLERASRAFAAANAGRLQRYSRRWVSDPLHHWSRQWEYPFVLSRLNSAYQERTPWRILDAGSGFTFFPSHVAGSLPAARVYCSDYDMRILRLYDGVEGPQRIDYSLASIDGLPFPDGSFDAVYSISVLEHTASPSRVVDEFARILRSGGLLILTFDVCRDGSRPLTVQQAGRLLDQIANRFQIAAGDQTPLAMQLSSPKLLTTDAAARLDRDLLPWRFPGILYQVQAILRGRPLGSWPPSLAVYCLEGRKR